MVKNLRSKIENRIKKVIKNAETRMAVYIYIYIVYCHLENKKEKLNNNKIRDRTILKIGNGMGLSLCVLYKKFLYKYQRAGPQMEFN